MSMLETIIGHFHISQRNIKSKANVFNKRKYNLSPDTSRHDVLSLSKILKFPKSSLGLLPKTPIIPTPWLPKYNVFYRLDMLLSPCMTESCVWIIWT